MLPGSRQQEISYLAEPFLQAAKQIVEQRPEVRFITSHANEKRCQEFHEAFRQYAPKLPLEFFIRRSHEVMAASDVVLVTSGTATLEVMLHKKPMVIAYRMSRLTYRLAKLLVKVPFVGLPNLLAHSEIVPELIQDAANPTNIAQHVLHFLDHPEQVQYLENKFTQLHKELSKGSINCISEAIFDMMQNK